MRPHRAVLFAILLMLATNAPAQQGAVSISLVNGGEDEQQAKEQLERLLATHDVENWIFTRRVQVDRTVIPHSHPVLTINTGHLDDDDHAMSTFLHEQFHWFINENRGNADAARRELRKHFPDAPDGPKNGGARDLRSTYLHLMVCDLEFQAISELFGEERARELLASNTHYTWIYGQVLDNPLVRQINERNKVVVPRR